MEYRDDWRLAEIALFEKFFVVSKFSTKPDREIFYQNDRLDKELHIRRKTRESAIKKLTNLGFIKRTNVGAVGMPTSYVMNFEVIFQNLDKIFKVDEALSSDKQQEQLKKKEAILRLYLDSPKMTHHMVVDAESLKPFIGRFSIAREEDDEDDERIKFVR